MICLHEVGAWLPDREGRHGVGPLDSLGQWETNLGVVELLDERSAAVSSLHNFHFNDLNINSKFVKLVFNLNIFSYLFLFIFIMDANTKFNLINSDA